MSLTSEEPEVAVDSIFRSEEEEIPCNFDSNDVEKPCFQGATEEREDGDEEVDEGPNNDETSCEKNTKKIRLEDPSAESMNTSGQIMSKSQRKRLIKQQKYLEIKKLRKLQKKEKQKLRREQRELEGEKVQEETGNEKHVKKYKTMDSEDALSLKVAIDLSFDDLMSDKDIKKLMKQVQRCYAENRRSSHPLQLYFTSFGGKSKQRLDDLSGHYVSWDVHIKNECLTEVFSKENIIYLTSDSPNVLKEIDMSKTYVIGGLVDHNHHKGLCYNMALERGLGHAQLPIGDFMKLSTRTVLTVNQVFEIILFYTESKDWQDAFNKVMPQRKITPKVKRKGKNRGVHVEQENNDDVKEEESCKGVDNSNDEDDEDQK
ncbi:tRNA methyltransferase 10 homolog A-like [Actinia tenebrosa]|uniref:tRNA (guanine(9)-N(1))-methyltransferase n=1 Tax=Actinia tenebrosa TaxID=6105 RepID=A0A6P8IUL4_ACTTE|nr:tRNA methyltransferase 10 homolog A-like [Actinia tenebrosa]